ncbi:phosphate propanoyltransferase [Solibacillus sp. FSL H8-0523]|uniref:phosphate propanoyltransferase n=1 Tax=Solibacillus sp. FSL H8-0523 TaxID=2954511 RepID=UPI0031012646
MDEQLIRTIVEQVLSQMQPTKPTQAPPGKIPIAVSARHVHLSEEHVKLLFGENYTLTSKAPLSQPNQFASQEQVTLVGPKATLHQVRVLGPARSLSQVEISMTDARTLGIDAPLRYSGDTSDSAPITLIGPKGSLYLKEGCIIAAAHIHMNEQDAKALHVVDGQFVNVQTCSVRPLVFQQVKVRVSSRFQLEMHIDTDEGNAAHIQGNGYGELVTAGVHKAPAELPPQQVQQLVPPKQTAVMTKKLITEQDIKELRQQELVIKKRTMMTALAQDMARKKGITIVRQ